MGFDKVGNDQVGVDLMGWDFCQIPTYPQMRHFGIGVGTWGGTGGICPPPCFINSYINCSLLYV